MACSCTKARISCSKFCKCEEHCQNVWNMVPENENESENSKDDDDNDNEHEDVE